MIENNNRETNFIQVWPDYVYTDVIPEVVPVPVTKALPCLDPEGNRYNAYRVAKRDYIDDSDKYYLTKVVGLKLIKEFRQGSIYRFADEELLRRIILPGTTTYREYQPVFTVDGVDVPYTVLNPIYDFSNCRITLQTTSDEVYITCWLYTGSTLADAYKPPFNDSHWLIKNEHGVKAKFEVQSDVDTSYVLPSADPLDVQEDTTLITTQIVNKVLNTIGVIDGGEYW